MTSDSTDATVYVGKLAAAQRQIDAAIRMLFEDEDMLAVHTVAAAAYGILRALNEGRGHDEISDRHRDMFFYLARDLATGRLATVPDWLASAPDMVEAVQHLATEIRSGRLRGLNDLRVDVPTPPRAFWANFNRPANFLKHANVDPGGLLQLDDVDNATLFIWSISGYLDLGQKPTPEMMAYVAYVAVDLGNLDGLDARVLPLAARLEECSPGERGAICRAWVKDRRAQTAARVRAAPAPLGVVGATEK